ncbi:BTAD domain-containing putative transcriptional regulator [Streptomyces dysideae]|uniref:Transcriptional regulator n=1 Tax=Streptomyces dysideae TaxID=909626 RepID=A0A101UYE0_9ACTN|nr:BTAD domain-containing putative transcriptional regulator [Streptomyces dysideae]KUO19170.1 transcriptional regulator [Streptomyces dysideae]
MTSYYSARARVRAAATAAGTGLITLALLVGMPWVLWAAAGVPWPQQVSSWGDLLDRIAEPVSDPLMIELLALFGWVCWSAVAGSVVREVAWYATHLPQLMRDRGVHAEHVATLPVKRSLAALCVGTLVVALLGLWRPHVASAQQPTDIGELRARVAATAPLHPASALTAASLKAGVDNARVPPPAEATEEQRHIEYTVVEGDTLWDIAATHLGDPVKWPRIYKLNKNRLQPDGGRLTDPDLIRPGWQLTVPVAGTAAPPPARPTVPAPSVPETPETPDKPEAHGDDERHAAHHDAQKEDVAQGHGNAQRHTERGPVAVSVGEASLIGITTAAGLLAALRYVRVHRNRSREPGTDVHGPELSPVVERATWAAREAALPRTSADPDTLLTRRIPPEQPQPDPVVTIGHTGDTETALNALAYDGGCDWSGPGAEAAARAMLCGILTAAERQRPEQPLLRAVVPQELTDRLLPGLPSQFTALTQATDTAHAIRLAEEHLIAHARQRQQTQEPGLESVLAALDGDHEVQPSAAPGTLLLLATPESAHIGQFEALARRTDPDVLLVLTLNAALPGAARWHIAADGTTTLPTGTPSRATGASRTEELRLFQLTAQAARDIIEVVLAAHGQRPRLRVIPAERTETVAPSTGDSAEADEENEAEPATPLPRPHPAEPRRSEQRKPIRLHVLGPVTLYARGSDDPVGVNLRAEVREFLALLAAHPAGLLAADIAQNLRLDGDSEQNARELKNLRRAVRRALRAATGITQQEFILLQGELHKLHPELVETDLADFTAALNRIAVTDDPSTQLASVREALRRYRGGFAHGGDHLWADGIREHLATKAADAVMRLAHHAEHTADTHQTDAALTALEHVIALHPDHEQLYQHAIRLYQAAGRQDAARHTYTRLERHLADLGLEPEPATQALIAPRTHARKPGKEQLTAPARLIDRRA